MGQRFYPVVSLLGPFAMLWMSRRVYRLSVVVDLILRLGVRLENPLPIVFFEGNERTLLSRQRGKDCVEQQ